MEIDEVYVKSARSARFGANVTVSATIAENLPSIVSEVKINED